MYIPPQDEKPWKAIKLADEWDSVDNALMDDAPRPSRVILDQVQTSIELTDAHIETYSSPAKEVSSKVMNKLSNHQMARRLLVPETEDDRRAVCQMVQRHRKLERIHLEQLRKDGMDIILNNSQEAGDPEVRIVVGPDILSSSVVDLVGAPCRVGGGPRRANGKSTSAVQCRVSQERGLHS